MIYSPLKPEVEAKSVPNTPYYEDPVSGLWFNPTVQIQEGFELEEASQEERAVSDNLASALWYNWMKQVRGPTVNVLASNIALSQALNKRTNASAETKTDWDKSFHLHNQKNHYRLITCIHGFQKIPINLVGCTLLNWKAALHPEGTLFIRMPDKKVKGFEQNLTEEHFKTASCFWDLDAFLELLWHNPIFKIAETYEMQPGSRDYLLKPIERKPQVCIGMIAKNEERDLPRCLQSLEGVAEGLVLIDTGSKDKTMQLATDWASAQGFEKFHVEQYLGSSEQDETGEWKLWDFAGARNQFVEKIEALDFDYVLWIDADDEIKTPEKLKKICFLDQYYIQAVQMNSGDLRWPHHRLWKTKQGVKFKGRCHEYPHNGSGQDFYHTDIEIYHDAAPGAHENSNARNLRILAREFEESPTPRCAFYLGNTHKDAGRWEEAIIPYQKRIDFGLGYADEYYFAVLYLARCQKFAGRIEEARATLLKATEERPDWAEFWVELARLEERFEPVKMLEYALRAKDLPIVPTHLFREANAYSDQPYRLISWAHEKLLDFNSAYLTALEAKEKIGGPDQDWDNRIARLKSLKMPTKICLYRPGALGDIIMTLNLIPALKAKNPDAKIVYRCHSSMKEVLEPLILQAGVDQVITEECPDAETIHLIGYPIQEGYPERPMRKHLLDYFAAELGVKSDFHAFKLPMPSRPRWLEENYVTIHPQAGWSPYKKWPGTNWASICQTLKEQGIKTYQIGSPKDARIPCTDERLLHEGFDACLAAMAHATLHLGVDSWSNHATNIQWEGKGRTPGVILWGSTQASAAGYPHNKNVILNLPCQPCFREDPKISNQSRGVCPYPENQTYDDPEHYCLNELSINTVMLNVKFAWNAVSSLKI